MLNKPYEISENWFKKHNVIFTEKQEIIKKDLLSIVYKLKIEIINRKIEDFDTALRNTENETEVLDIVQKKQTYLKAKVELAKQLGSVFI